jgi:hypothetical protein
MLLSAFSSFPLCLIPFVHPTSLGCPAAIDLWSTTSGLSFSDYATTAICQANPDSDDTVVETGLVDCHPTSKH